MINTQEQSGKPGTGQVTAPDDDPTRIRSQPALTRSTGRVWLIVGGIFTVMALAVLVPMTALPPAGVALTAAMSRMASDAEMWLTASAPSDVPAVKQTVASEKTADSGARATPSADCSEGSSMLHA